MESLPDEINRLRSKLPEDYHNFPIHSSPLKRCHKLAQELSDQSVTTDEQLMELDFGKWEGRAWDDIEDEELQPWMQNFVEAVPPGGESYRQLYDRVTGWWEEFIKAEHKQVLVVTHAGVIRCLLSHVLGLPLENSFRLTIDYGSISKIVRQNNRNVIEYLNR